MESRLRSPYRYYLEPVYAEKIVSYILFYRCERVTYRIAAHPLDILLKNTGMN